MGSGCSVNNNTANLFQKRTPDTGVKYTGPAIPSLGICTGDTLSEIEAVILDKIVKYATGNDIFIQDIDLRTCDAFADCVVDCCQSTSIELPDLLDCFKNAICSIYEDVADIKDQLDDLFNASYNYQCISSLSGTPTFREILQAWLIDYCALKAQVTTLQTTVNNLVTNLPATIGNFLSNAISSCTGTGSVIKSGTGSGFTVQFKGFVPIGGIIPYGGAMNKFDSTGLGLTGTDMCGWALANGLNGTKNMIGQVPIGMVNGMGGSVPSNYTGGPSTSMGDQIGEPTHLNTANESGTANHTHPVIEPNGGQGHSHKFAFGADNGPNPGSIPNYMKFDGGNLTANLDGTPANDGNTGGGIGNVAVRVKFNTTGITLGNAGSAATQAHNNIQSSTALAYIQRIS